MDLHFKLAFNTSVQIIGKILTATSTILITYLLTRKFSVGDYGTYTAVLSYVSLFYVFTDFGLNAVFVKETSGDLEKQKDFFAKLLALRLTSSIIVIFAALSFLSFLNYSSLLKFGVIAALGLVITQSLTNSTLAFFQTKIEYQKAVVADIFGSVASLALVFLTIQIFSSIIFVILALLLASVVKVAIALYFVKAELGGIKFNFDISYWEKIILASLPIGLISIFSSFNAQSDKQVVILAHYQPSLHLTGQTAAGIYGFSYKLFEVAIVLPTFIMNVAFPLMIEHYKQGLKNLFNYAREISFLLLALGFLGLIVGWFLTPFVVSFLGGGKFGPAVLTTRILLLGFPLFFITPLTLWLGITLEKVKEIMFIYGLVALSNFAANLFLVPLFGYNAASVTTVAAEALILLFSLSLLALNKNNFKEYGQKT